jgi:hypothetical protein
MNAAEQFDTVVKNCYQKYQAIRPESPADPEIRHLVEEYIRPGSCLWDDVKASVLYARFPRPEKSTFVFTMAGRELARLKAGSSEKSRTIVSSIHANMRPKPFKAPIQYDEEDEGDDFETALEEQIL